MIPQIKSPFKVVKSLFPWVIFSMMTGLIVLGENSLDHSFAVFAQEISIFSPLNKPPKSLGWKDVKQTLTLRGHVSVVDSLAFSPDSNILISGGSYNDPFIRLWTLYSGKEIERIRAQRTAILALVLSPDGQILASSGDDAGVNLWNWKTGEYSGIFFDHSSNVLSMVITPDSQVLVSGGLDGIKVWDLRTERLLYTLARFDNPTYALAINPNGYILAAGLGNGGLKFWNLRTGEVISEVFPHNDSIRAIAFTPDGKTLVTGSDDRSLKVWDLTTGQEKYTLIGHTDKVRAIAIHPNGQILASGSHDGIRLWDLRNGQLINHWSGHEDWVQSLAFSPDGTRLATGGFDNQIHIWESVVPD